jgi:hypothetical protein
MILRIGTIFRHLEALSSLIETASMGLMSSRHFRAYP